MIVLFFIFFVFFPSFSSGKTFKCYHGSAESLMDNNFKSIQCPSEKCIMFNSPCNSYFSTTCYDDTRPMEVVNAFPNSKKLYKGDRRNFANFGYCEYSLCNDGIIAASLLQHIPRDPISFDHRLWPALRPQISRFNLRNTFTDIVLDGGQSFTFFGKTFAKNKKIWIEFNYVAKNGSFVTARFDFNLVKANFISQIIVSTMKITTTSPWSSSTKPGQIATFTIKNEEPNGYKLTFNSVSLGFLPLTAEYIKSIGYGGGWKMINATNVNDPEPMIPGFNYEQPRKFACNSQKIPPKTKLKYYNIIDKILTPQIHILSRNISVKKIGSTKNTGSAEFQFEFRESLCPNSNLAKFQVNVPKYNLVEYFTIEHWYRISSSWNMEAFDFAMKKGCKNFNIGIQSGSIQFFCDEKSVLFKSNLQITPNFFVEGSAEKFVCPK